MKINTGGVHHLALVCKDMRATHEFYTGVMKMELTCAIHVPPYKEEDAMHLFYDMGGGNQLAFFWFKDAPAGETGQAHPASPAHVNANGSMHHLAFSVDSEADLNEWRAHLTAREIRVTPIIDHDFCRSIYFADPDGMQLEISYWARALEQRDISDKVLAQAGIKIGAPATV